ncbi:MAG TPA: methyltransferase domain-containing protein [bacterium]|jgi:2-polyprenyl-3-methyl-5-hydroxy-6-metoxy-1,4-benzoquinol methylase|nr:methyltransferase domain-containing protein [bacterium]
MSRQYADTELTETESRTWERDRDYLCGRGLIVDLGCGPGRFMEMLKQRSDPFYGVDMERASVETCRRQGFKVERMDALRHLRSRKKGVLGGIHCYSLIEHIPKEHVEEFLGHCFRTLKKGGRLVLGTANGNRIDTVVGGFWDDFQHVRPYTALLLRHLAEEQGFEVDFSGGDELTRKQSLARKLLRKIRTVLVGPYYGPPGIVLLARKP